MLGNNGVSYLPRYLPRLVRKAGTRHPMISRHGSFSPFSNGRKSKGEQRLQVGHHVFHSYNSEYSFPAMEKALPLLAFSHRPVDSIRSLLPSSRPLVFVFVWHTVSLLWPDLIHITCTVNFGPQDYRESSSRTQPDWGPVDILPSPSSLPHEQSLWPAASIESLAA